MTPCVYHYEQLHNNCLACAVFACWCCTTSVTWDTFFHSNKFLANWRTIALRTKIKIFCGSPSQTFSHWLIEHEHYCEMESMIVFCFLSPLMPSSILFTVLLTSLCFGFFGLPWWGRESVTIFLGALTLYKSRTSEFLDYFNTFWYVEVYLEPNII